MSNTEILLMDDTTTNNTSNDTIKHRGTQTFTVSDKLHQIIQKWRIINKTKFLLVNPSKHDEQMSTSQLSRILINNIGLSATKIRHQYVADTFKNDSTYKEKLESAKLLGHSVDVQQRVYRY